MTMQSMFLDFGHGIATIADLALFILKTEGHVDALEGVTAIRQQSRLSAIYLSRPSGCSHFERVAALFSPKPPLPVGTDRRG